MANVNQVLKIERDETLCTGVGVVCIDGLNRAVWVTSEPADIPITICGSGEIIL